MKQRKIRIGIVGLGGIGGFIGAKLARFYQDQEQVETVFICRGETLERIQTEGLVLKTPSETIKVKPDVVSNLPSAIGVLDVLILTTKTYALANVLKEYEAVITENTVLITLQNSVNASELVRNTIPVKGDVLEGCIYVASNVVEPGVVHHVGGPGKVFFGNSHIEKHRWIEVLLQDAGIDAKLVPNIEEVLWTKYLFVAPIAAVTTAYNLTFGQLTSEPDKKVMLENLMTEIKQLAAAKSIMLPHTIVSDSLALIQKFPFEAKSSMQLDFEQGKPTEINSLLNYVLEQSEKYGLQTPVYTQVYDKIKAKMSM